MNLFMALATVLIMSMSLSNQAPMLLLVCLILAWSWVLFYALHYMECLPVEFLEKLTDFENLKVLIGGLESEEQQITKEEIIEFLDKKVVGHSRAKAQIAQGVADNLTLRRGKGVVCSILLNGGTGIGKTELARSLASLLFNNKKPLDAHSPAWFEIHCNGTEEHEWGKYFGIAGGYAGHGKGATLTNHLRKYPKSLILVDEIDKVKGNTLPDSLMTMLDEGYYIDKETGKKIMVDQCVFVLTSNLLADETQAMLARFGEDEKELDRAINRELIGKFRKEFVGRIDLKILLEPLSKIEKAEIACRIVASRCQSNDISLTFVEPEVFIKFLEEEEGKDLGIRGLANVIDNLVKPQLIQAKREDAEEVSARLTPEGAVELEIVRIREYE